MKLPTTSRTQRYLSVLARWCCITFVVFGITLWTGKYITENVLPKTYEATAKIQVGSERITELPELNPAEPPSPLIQAEFAIMESRDILLPVIHDLGLDQAWAKRVPHSGEEKLSDSDALAEMGKILKLDYTRGTNIIDLTVSSDNPIETARIANAIADRYKAKRDVEQPPSPGDPKEGYVRILTRPITPAYPSKPNNPLYFIATVGIAALVSLVAGCFVEVILLICRAANGEKTSDGVNQR
jgi:capsular polysaccharide biosynthesis protein